MSVLLKVVKGPHVGRIFQFDEHDTFIVGRAPTAQFHLSDDDLFFSRNHFLIEVNPPLCRLLDLNSRNGTFVNGQRVSAVDLKSGDRIRGGKTVLRVAVGQNSAEGEDAGTALRVGPDAPIVPQNRPPEVNAEASVPPAEPAAAASDSTPDGGAMPKSPADEPRTGDDGKDLPETLPYFPGYQTVQVIGRGGMGCVYEARSLSDARRVAIKVFSANAAATENDIARFIREADILKELVHPNIVGFHDLRHNSSNGSLFIVMDHVAGSNAEAILRKLNRPVSVRRAVAWIMQLLDALRYAHARGYIHRDVKPSNLLVAGRGKHEKLYLADFGLARVYQTSKLSGLTMTGEIGGSTPLMPPEQITNYRNVDPSADQYSAAATLYYLLSKETVYEFPRDVARQLLLILQEEPIPLDRRRPDLPDALVKVIHRALSRRPSLRFDDVEAFQHALAAATSDL